MRDIVREELDSTAILPTYTEARSFPPHDPGMMVALLLYAYTKAPTPRSGLRVAAKSGWIPGDHGLEPAGA